MQPWRLSFGVFGAGERGANYQKSLSQPLLMAQAETQLKLFGGLNGNYRIYGWNRSEADDFDGTSSKHTGVGVRSTSAWVTGSMSLPATARCSRVNCRSIRRSPLVLNSTAAIGAAPPTPSALALAGCNPARRSGRIPATAYLDSSQLTSFTYTPSGAEQASGNLLPLPHLAAI
jgi:high affinity Mn2+ porin